jgi:hypothetical protein
VPAAVLVLVFDDLRMAPGTRCSAAAMRAAARASEWVEYGSENTPLTVTIEQERESKPSERYVFLESATAD